MICKGMVFTGAVKRDGNPIKVRCGITWNSEKHLCPECKERARRIYPQGWRYYPGDTCKHGTYVGGCGADYMCGLCESGEEPRKHTWSITVGFVVCNSVSGAYSYDDRTLYVEACGLDAAVSEAINTCRSLAFNDKVWTVEYKVVEDD